MSRAGGRPRVLYVYDFEGWAIHQVGLSWGHLLGSSADLICLPIDDARQMSAEALESFDRHVLGFSTLLDGPPWLGLDATTRGVAQTRAALNREFRLRVGQRRRDSIAEQRLRRSLTVVHDPMELFPERPDWRTTRPWLARVRHFQRVAVISDEMASILRHEGVACSMVHTVPNVPIAQPEQLRREGCRPLSVCTEQRRKNIPLLQALKAQWDAECGQAPFTLRLGRQSESRAVYTELLDAHSLYVCTSWQEGGPLPLMEAVCRGLAIVTSPVGQVARWVQHGVNGFICHTPEAFHAALAQLAADAALLHRMRLASLAIAAERARDPVRDQLLKFLAF